MKLIRYYILGTFYVLCLFSLNAQSLECNNYHKRSLCYREAYAEGFNYYGQSASALAEKGVTLTYNAVFYGGKDYIINLCCLPLFEPVHMVIYDADTDELIYDNEEDEYLNRVAFTMEFTRSLLFEITVIGDGLTDGSLDSKRTCVGILILWRKVPKIGF